MVARHEPELVLCDAVELLGWMPSASVNCIITDPAYESLEKHRYGAESCRRLTDWFDIFPNHRFVDFFREAYRVLVKGSHMYIMCDEETADVIKPIGKAAGFTFWKSVIWDRVHRGQGYHYANTHEFVLFFEKGKRQLNDRRHLSIVRGIPRVMRSGYPTEKPFRLYDYFIGNSVRPGDHVVDPFLGAGAGALSAYVRGAKFTGCDLSQRSLDETRARLSLLKNILAYRQAFGQ